MLQPFESLSTSDLTLACRLSFGTVHQQVTTRPTAGKRTRGLKGTRKLQFTGGIVGGSSTQIGSLTAAADEAVTTSVIGGTAASVKNSGGTNSFVNAPNGQANGASGAASSGMVGAGVTSSMDINMGPATQEAGLTLNAAGSFLGGFSPANVVGTTTILQSPIIFAGPNGFTGGSGASSGNIGTSNTLTNPSSTTKLDIFANGAGEVASFGGSTGSNVFGNAGSITQGNTKADAASTQNFDPGINSGNGGGSATGNFAQTASGLFGGPRTFSLNQVPGTTAIGPFSSLP
jgi:hypothetical protein